MEVTPKFLIVEKFKEMAAQEGISIKAMLVPFLNDIADGRLVRVPHYPPQGPG